MSGSRRVALVSCAGPDDNNDPATIAALGTLTPLMEIAVQASASRAGSREYPSIEWLQAFARQAAACGYQAAIHVNGRWCRSLLSGSVPRELAGLIDVCDRAGRPAFRRVQLNFDAADAGATSEAILRVIKSLMPRRVVLQHNAGNASLVDSLAAHGADFDVLFDASLGLGICPDAWPDPVSGHFCAYAGGFSPENVRERLDAIGPMQERDFGIDAQSGLRAAGPDGWFDPARAAGFARAATAWNDAHGQGR